MKAIVDEGKFDLDLYLYPVTQLEKLDVAYLHFIHVGNEALQKTAKLEPIHFS